MSVIMLLVYDEDELRRFDGSIKKNTAFVKKLVSVVTMVTTLIDQSLRCCIERTDRGKKKCAHKRL